MVQEMLGVCEAAESGTKIDELLQDGASGTKEHGKMLKRIQVLKDGRVSAKLARNWKIGGQKKRITKIRVSEAFE